MLKQTSAKSSKEPPRYPGFGKSISDCRKKRDLSREQLQEQSRLSKSYLEKISAGRQKPNPEPALKLLRLLRVLKPSSEDLPVFLREAGLMPLFRELAHIVQEAGVFSLITEETGVTWSSSLQEAISTRRKIEKEVLDIDALEYDSTELMEPINDWGKAIDEAKIEHICDAHTKFHKAIVNTAYRAGHICEERKTKYSKLIEGTVLFVIGSYYDLADEEDSLVKDKWKKPMWNEQQEKCSRNLHLKLAKALIERSKAGSEERKLQIQKRLDTLFDLHWSWAFISEDQLAAILP